MKDWLEVVIGSAEDVARVSALYPCLLWTETVNGLVLRGGFPVLHDGAELDSFSVEIRLLGGPRNFVPVVYEVGGRIPRVVDRHVFPTEGAACLGLPEELLLATHGEPMTLLAFLDGPVRSYFLAQTIFERDGVWPFGDRRHGCDGLYDFIEETFGSRDAAVVSGYLRVLSADSVRGHWLCPCGKGSRIRRCHEHQIRNLRSRIPRQVAIRLSDLLSRRTANVGKGPAEQPKPAAASRRRTGILGLLRLHPQRAWPLRS